LPFLNGFYSKELFFDATTQLTEGAHALTIFLHEAIPYLAVFGSIFTFVYSLYLFFGVFTGPKQLDKLPLKPVEARFGMLLSPFFLMLCVLTVVLFPNAFTDTFLVHAAQAVNEAVSYEPILFWHGFSTPFVMSLTVVGLGTLLLLRRKRWEQIYQRLPGKWSF